MAISMIHYRSLRFRYDSWTGGLQRAEEGGKTQVVWYRIQFQKYMILHGRLLTPKEVLARDFSLEKKRMLS